jgi:exodeoxyribonuclease-3
MSSQQREKEMSPQPTKVTTYNCNSVRARLELVLDWLEHESPNVLCLQETKVQDADFPVEAFEGLGYHVAFRGQKAHAGVAIVSTQELQDVAFGLDDDGESEDTRLARATMGDVTLINTYVPQGRTTDSVQFQYKLDWLRRLRAFFDRHYTPQDSILWVGDFNVAPETIDVYDPQRLAKHVDFHPDARRALEEVRAWGFVDVFRHHHPEEPGQYTFWDYRVPDSLERGMGWRVDHIWATRPLAEKSTSSWIDVDARRAERPSDHTLLTAQFAL